uniref:Probable magnesium transporter n=1 Tax=Aegilops tauschii subsp. strangulata TaxID=200361 RepID=A0A452Z5W0_AEGTS
MSVKALGIALKLTFSGMNQLVYPQTWFFTLVVIACIVTQMNYLNKALDTFNTAVVSPIYYTMFTSLTILASVIMFKGLGSSKSDSNCHGNVWFCYYPFWDVSASQDKRHGGWSPTEFTYPNS